MTHMSYATTDLQRKSGEITDAIAAGHTVTLTRYRKAFATITPAAQAAAPTPGLPADLLDPVAEFAAANGIDTAEALRRLVTAGLNGTAAPRRKKMFDLFPDVAAGDVDELVECVQAEEDHYGEGESCEYEYGGVEFCLSYSKVRGHWFFERQAPTAEKDERGFRKWAHEYTLCKNKAEAKKLYREAIIEASKAWDPESGADGMWVEAWDTTFNEFVKLGAKSPVPLASFGADDES
jgi:antitoxin (DNA-binding transcriptional repressor) of toxin-antitoxin stability system